MPLSPLDLLICTTKDLGGNLVRSALTTLGIFMGVAAVNATLNINDISRAQIAEKLAALDNPFLVPQVVNMVDGFYDTAEGVPTPEDLDAMAQKFPNIASISQVTQIWGNMTVQYEGQMVNDADVSGVSENYQRTTGRKILQGRFFNKNDFSEYLPVAVLSQLLVDQLFQGADPVGQGIYISGVRLTVVGVIENKDNSSFGKPRGELWLTNNYSSALAGGYTYQSHQIALRNLESYQLVQDQIKEFLTQRYPNSMVAVYGNARMLHKEDQQQRNSSRILLVVGLLALVIGGVGIANITVASVMERTREIGLRRAIGATDLEVMSQFMMEAVILSMVGGMAAIATVHILTQTATTTLFTDAPYRFKIENAALSMAAAFGVGVGASFFPALRVTQIDVVQALRGE